MSDQLVPRPLPKHRTTQTQNKHIHTQNIHALSGIRTHDPGFRASEDSACLRPLGYRDRRYGLLLVKFSVYDLERIEVFIKSERKNRGSIKTQLISFNLPFNFLSELSRALFRVP
jgi:hypothetical protein